MLFKKKQSKPDIRLDNVNTLLNNSIQGQDRNKDGIPDYLQRQDIPSMIKSNKDLNQWEADTLNEIESWIMGLRGYEFDPNDTVYKPVSPPTLNEIGIRKLKTHINVLVNKHAINTNLKKEEMHEIIEYHVATLIRWFKYNAKKSSVSYSDLSPIIAEFDNLCTIVLSRSVDGGNRLAVTQRTKLTGSVSGPSPSFPN